MLGAATLCHFDRATRVEKSVSDRRSFGFAFVGGGEYICDIVG